MNEIAKEVFKQLINLGRLILFIPIGFLAGKIAWFPLFLMAKIQESMFGLKADSWGSHLWLSLVTYVVCFYASISVKPKFLKSKYFILAWSIVLGFNAFIYMSVLPDPLYSTRMHIIVNAFAPIAVLIWFIKDKNNDLNILE